MTIFKKFKYHWAVFFSVIGPGFITAMVDNDAGGILTYSQAGAKYGYLPLWTLLPITILLVVTQEMCSRMGAVTEKGLSDLIREEFGLRTTFFVMLLLVLANLTNVMANFAGIASSLELFGISRYITVPLGAAAVWFMIVKGTYESVEKIFLWACVVYVAYIVSGVLVEPNWKEAAVYSVKPVLLLDPGYLSMLIGMVGTSVAPWMQFYLQASIVEKGVTPKQYRTSRWDVILGCLFTGGTLYVLATGELPVDKARTMVVNRSSPVYWIFVAVFGSFGMLSISPSSQGRGLGRHVIGQIEAYCRRRGCTRIEIVVVNLRTELPPLYRRFGYIETDTKPFPDPAKINQPCHLIVMTKSLA